MIQFKEEHKIRIPSKHDTRLDWFGEELDVQNLEDDELFAKRTYLKSWYNEQLAIIDNEINRWEPIFCAVCGEEDLAFRGKPFVTWGLRGGYPLCPRHTRAYDRVGTPKAAVLKQLKAEDKEIGEIFVKGISVPNKSY